MVNYFAFSMAIVSVELNRNFNSSQNTSRIAHALWCIKWDNFEYFINNSEPEDIRLFLAGGPIATPHLVLNRLIFWFGQNETTLICAFLPSLLVIKCANSQCIKIIYEHWVLFFFCYMLGNYHTSKHRHSKTRRCKAGHGKERHSDKKLFQGFWENAIEFLDWILTLADGKVITHNDSFGFIYALYSRT